MKNQQVLIIGGGVTGISAAIELANHGKVVRVVDRADFMGGHAIQFTCKATSQCVKCGACVVEKKLGQAIAVPNITLTSASRIGEISRNGRFSLDIHRQPIRIDANSCTNCGRCYDQCPSKGAIVSGYSNHHHPFFAISEDNCLYFQEDNCSICADTCPENAIDLNEQPWTEKVDADAVIVATGFNPFNPVDKPYGHGAFPNTVSNLELERMLRQAGQANRPSDGAEAQRIAFIQCVGSRDAKAGHLWCSTVCCGSALRMAALIKSRQPDTAITFFYIDIQTFGKDFKRVYSKIEKEIRMIRSIPADIYPEDDNRLKVVYADDVTHESSEALFDLVVLSVGMTPKSLNESQMSGLGLAKADTGFLQAAAPARSNPATSDTVNGVFAAGAATGPMSIAESVAHAGKIAWQTLRYLDRVTQEAK